MRRNSHTACSAILHEVLFIDRNFLSNKKCSSHMTGALSFHRFFRLCVPHNSPDIRDHMALSSTPTKGRSHDGPAASAHKEGHHIRKKRRLFSHEDHCHRVTEHPAQDSCSNYLSQVCGQQFSRFLIQDSAEQRPPPCSPERPGDFRSP